MLESHSIKHGFSTQPIVALSGPEAEFTAWSVELDKDWATSPSSRT